MKKQIIVSSIIIFMLGYLFHYLYDLSNQNYIVGLFSPVNESIFEHLKILLYPIIIWWVGFYLLKKDKYKLNRNSWFLSILISLLLSFFLVSSLYYLFKCGLNIESPTLNISIMILTIFICQTISLKIYEKKINVNYLISLITIFIIISLTIFLTIKPPKLPLFEDPKTKTYGIKSA